MFCLCFVCFCFVLLSTNRSLVFSSFFFDLGFCCVVLPLLRFVGTLLSLLCLAFIFDLPCHDV